MFGPDSVGGINFYTGKKMLWQGKNFVYYPVNIKVTDKYQVKITYMISINY